MFITTAWTSITSVKTYSPASRYMYILESCVIKCWLSFCI